MNHLKNIKSFRNQYYLMRHGESLANAEGIMVSSPKNALDGFGLTQNGRQQVVDSIINAKINGETVIFSSDFLRTKETAIIAAEKLNIKEVEYSKMLRERYFGDYEAGSESRYIEVWEADKKDLSQTNMKVESAKSVIDRMTRQVVQIEEAFKEKNILIISHNDPLQFLLAAFWGVDFRLAHENYLFKNGELKKIIIEN